EARIPEIVPVLYKTMEKLSFIGDFAELPEIALEWVRRIEVMRGLHHAQLSIACKPAECRLQERASGNMVGIENGNIFPVREAERMINVSSFGVCDTVAGDVTGADL